MRCAHAPDQCEIFLNESEHCRLMGYSPVWCEAETSIKISCTRQTLPHELLPFFQDSRGRFDDQVQQLTLKLLSMDRGHSLQLPLGHIEKWWKIQKVWWDGEALAAPCCYHYSSFVFSLHLLPSPSKGLPQVTLTQKCSKCLRLYYSTIAFPLTMGSPGAPPPHFSRAVTNPVWGFSRHPP